jgi:hypothetical protein
MLWGGILMTLYSAGAAHGLLPRAPFESACELNPHNKETCARCCENCRRSVAEAALMR